MMSDLLMVSSILMRLQFRLRHTNRHATTRMGRIFITHCNNVMTVIDKYPTMIHNMLVLSSCTRCNRLC